MHTHACVVAVPLRKELGDDEAADVDLLVDEEVQKALHHRQLAVAVVHRDLHREKGRAEAECRET